MAFVHKDRYEGIRWRLVYGDLEGPQRFALNEMQRMLQRQLPYVLAVGPATGTNDSDSHLVLLGTPENNPVISGLIEAGRMQKPNGPGGYSLLVTEPAPATGGKIIAVAGSDEQGVLHGTADFCSRVLSAKVYPDDPCKMREALDAIEPLQISERPLIRDRGIWTWGYVIYDYRRFLDNMARLKMNTITIWNDHVPVNAREVVDYAHSRGIKVIFGFHWGWGIADLDMASGEHLQQVRGQVLQTWKEQYRGTGCDGIYFQTATEHDDREIGGRSVAALARDWVNGIATALLEEEADLTIQFGLHATSIGDHYQDLAGLDPRVSIVWENAGAIPYSYEPLPEFPEPVWSVPKEMLTAEATLKYSRELAKLRPNCEFAMVAKGWIKLRWESDFEHHGAFVLGERDRGWIRRRLEERRPRWDHVNRLWLQHYPVAARFYREILKENPAGMNITGLVEDGMFSEEIPISVALLAETLWNPQRPDTEILSLAQSPYYRLDH